MYVHRYYTLTTEPLGLCLVAMALYAVASSISLFSKIHVHRLHHDFRHPRSRCNPSLSSVTPRGGICKTRRTEASVCIAACGRRTFDLHVPFPPDTKHPDHSFNSAQLVPSLVALESFQLLTIHVDTNPPSTHVSMSSALRHRAGVISVCSTVSNLSVRTRRRRLLMVIHYVNTCVCVCVCVCVPGWTAYRAGLSRQ